MELYLDSADLNEIKEAFQLGFLAGLTTTPTFMHRHGIKDIDGTIMELSKIVPILQIEALGDKAEEIVAEAHRQDALGLDRNKTVYKIPISLEGAKACKILRNEGFLVNIHLIYTLQQAYMAMEAGATYVCPLVGRLQDQGTDALQVVEQIVEAVNYYNYDCKVMFSSVRNVEHVRNALSVGVHTITAPWKIIKQLPENHFTELGTRQFVEHTRLMTLKVKHILDTQQIATVTKDASVADCLVLMTSSGFGAVAIIDDKQEPIGIFTDGDLRRLVNAAHGSVTSIKVSELGLKKPLTICEDAFLIDAQQMFTEKQVDNLIVVRGEKVVGMIDIQNLVKVIS